MATQSSSTTTGVGSTSEPMILEVLPCSRNPAIWQNFNLCKMSDGTTKAQCKLCFYFLSSGSNSTLKAHINNKYCETLKSVSEAGQSSIARDGSIFVYNPDVVREQFAGLVIQEALLFNHSDNPRMTRVVLIHLQPSIVIKEYERIFMCNTAKEIWKALLITHQDESIDNAFATFNTIVTSLKALDEESKDLTSLSLDELIRNLKVHEMIIKKDFEIVKAKGERRSLALKAKKESSDEECLTSGSEDEHGECPKPPKDKNQRAFVGGSWSDSGEEDDEKDKDETCLVAQASNEICIGVDLEPDEWIKDSGCSKHMMGNQKLFSTYKAYNGGNVISGRNLRSNIIGKCQICDNKCRVTFSEHDSEITKDGKVIGRGIRKKCLYVMKLGNKLKDKICLATIDENSTLWHRRLGHANMRLIQSLVSKELVRNLPKLKFDQHFCDAWKISSR
ncbi:retrovirus-related pol polyprotein from transposon TNT 1-94 [Tanacetum coccineum]|uniref:Retrovirus-related pol polyprotein from transposon TNT 1-94 n=1 Tax=Tanacetum coccineum TaxID=301880 RepID=A0ABQ5BLX3_9ASTR